MRKSDLTDVSKPLKTEKKDALANIDINNYASKLGTLEPCHKKTCLRVFRPGLTQTRVFNH